MTAFGKDTVLVGLKIGPNRGGRVKVACHGPGRRRVGRRYKLSAKQVAQIWAFWMCLDQPDGSVALVGIWREASRLRDPDEFAAQVVAELEALWQEQQRRDREGRRR
jgi:hypothetical protein